MTTDLIKTLEGLDVKKNDNVYCMEDWVWVCRFLPQIISKLKDVERFREALEESLEWLKDVEDAGIRYVSLGAETQRMRFEQALTPTADTKESKPHA